MHSYQAARKSFGALEVLAKVVIVLGGLAAFGGASVASNGTAMLLAALPGVVLVVLGFFGLTYVQTSRAAVDTAEFTQQMLGVSRDQYDISKQLLKLAQAPKPAGYEAAKETPKPVRFDTERPAEPTSEPAPVRFSMGAAAKTEYNGHVISEKAGVFLVDGRQFDTLMDAKEAIDGLRLSAEPVPIEAK